MAYDTWQYTPSCPCDRCEDTRAEQGMTCIYGIGPRPPAEDRPHRGNRLPRVHYPEYHVRWSEEDQEFVATCDWYPSMSYLDRDCVRALSGLADSLLETFGDEGLVARCREINRQRGYLR